jgi:iron complex outermembrane receptor protein
MHRNPLRTRPRLLAATLAALAATAAAADAPDPVLLDALVVTAPRTPTRVQPPQLTLDPTALRARQPLLVADAVRGLPGVSIRPNSRGESVVRVRGAEERQTAVFLDGAPLAVPWDGRVDLGLLPAGLVGAISVTKGAVPIEYGPNAVAGVLDLQTRRDVDTRQAELTGGNLGQRALSAAGQWQRDPGHSGWLETTLAAGWVTRDAQAVADPAALPFSQSDRDARTNTDLDSRSLFAAAALVTGDALWRLSLLHADARRGIAPEAHLDPSVDAPRYWRYPDWRLTQLNFAGETPLGEHAAIRGVAWQQWFDQTITAYPDARYDRPRSREHSDDASRGVRLGLTHPFGPLALRWSATAQTSTHDQVDTRYPAGAPVPGPQLRYRQRLHSLGVEAGAPLAAAVRATFGLGLDHAATPLTGDKPGQRDQQAPAYSAALAWAPAPHWHFALSTGRRTRFPSPRELYGEALGRFLPNPGLDPETAVLADLELAWQAAGKRLTFNPFYQDNQDTLAQRQLVVAGRTLRQRINLPGSRAYGVDLSAALPLRPDLRLEFGGAWLRTAVTPTAALPFRGLPQRPQHELFVAGDWTPWRGLGLRAEARRIGDAFDIGPDGQPVALRAATEFNLRASLPLSARGPGRPVELIAAVDNLTHAVIEPQLGLPLPGRSYRLGLRFAH